MSARVVSVGTNLAGDEQADTVDHGGPIEALLIDRSRLPELEPARADMLPKLAGWYAER